jgi:hypothetical protein
MQHPFNSINQEQMVTALTGLVEVHDDAYVHSLFLRIKSQFLSWNFFIIIIVPNHFVPVDKEFLVSAHVLVLQLLQRRCLKTLID